MDKRWHGEESRWGNRVRVNIPVQVSGNDTTADGCMRNLSLSGALVKTDVDLGLHAIVQVRINATSPPQRKLITAYVSRKMQEGVGVEWCEFAPDAVKELLRAPAGA